jgi:hypothetical protein
MNGSAPTDAVGYLNGHFLLLFPVATPDLFLLTGGKGWTGKATCDRTQEDQNGDNQKILVWLMWK